MMMRKLCGEVSNDLHKSLCFAAFISNGLGIYDINQLLNRNSDLIKNKGSDEPTLALWRVNPIIFFFNLPREVQLELFTKYMDENGEYLMDYF